MRVPFPSLEEKLSLLEKYWDALHGQKCGVFRDYGFRAHFHGLGGPALGIMMSLLRLPQVGRLRVDGAMTPKRQSAQIVRLRLELAKAQPDQEILNAALQALGKCTLWWRRPAESAEPPRCRPRYPRRSRRSPRIRWIDWRWLHAGWRVFPGQAGIVTAIHGHPRKRRTRRKSACSQRHLPARSENLVVPVRSGAAWVVPAGLVVRFTTPEGPQVLDVNLWSLQNPRERFWASRTRQMYGAHVTVGDRHWSSLPYLRPLATVVADSLAYGRDANGTGCHDLLGTRCDPYVSSVLSRTAYDFHCHSNLTRAVAPFGLTEYDVHDVINVFKLPA